MYEWRVDSGWLADGNDRSCHRTLSHLSYVHLWLRIIIVSNHRLGQSMTDLHLVFNKQFLKFWKVRKYIIPWQYRNVSVSVGLCDLWLKVCWGCYHFSDTIQCLMSHASPDGPPWILETLETAPYCVSECVSILQLLVMSQCIFTSARPNISTSQS